MNIGESNVPTAVDQRAAAAFAEVQRRGADSWPHGFNSFLGHLCGTHDILTTWRQPERVRLAGAVHSAYATEAFPRALFDLSEREALRALIGDQAERLVYVFCAIHRNELFAQLRSKG